MLIAFAIPLAAAALLVAGCGDDDGDDGTTSEAQSSSVQWASQVCGAIGDWETSITTIDFSDGISKDALSQNIDEAEQATKDLIDQLKAVGAPETDDGEQAKQEIDRFADELETTVDSVKEDAEALADSDAAGLASGLTTIAVQVTQIIDDGKQTLTDLEELDPQGQLSEAIKNDETCQSLSSE